MKLILFVGENETSTDNIKCAKQCVRKSDYCRLGKKPVLPFRPGKKGGHKSDLQENANKVKISKTLYTKNNTLSTRFTGLFNWTMSYRKDSDIYVPYGWLKLTGQLFSLHDFLYTVLYTCTVEQPTLALVSIIGSN